MLEFDPDPSQIAPPGLMVGPLGDVPEVYKERHAIMVATVNGLTTVVRVT